MSHTILRGGLLLDIAASTAEPADILIEGDTIRELGPPGCAAPEGATEISAARRLLHPGLVNAHTHGIGNFAKGMGDRWTLELLLKEAVDVAVVVVVSAVLGCLGRRTMGCLGAAGHEVAVPVPGMF